MSDIKFTLDFQVNVEELEGTLKDNKPVIVVGTTGTGKSYLIKELLYNTKAYFADVLEELSKLNPEVVNKYDCLVVDEWDRQSIISGIDIAEFVSKFKTKVILITQATDRGKMSNPSESSLTELEEYHLVQVLHSEGIRTVTVQTIKQTQ